MSAENALADLGLDFGAEATTEVQQEAPVATAPVADTGAEEVAATTRKAVRVTTVVSDEFEDLPALERAGFGGGNREKKYPFDELAAPVELADGRMGYRSFTVLPDEGEDIDRAIRSAQSATTQANRQAKEAGEATYFVTRTFTENGEVKGLKVFRTDARPEKGE